MNLRKLFSIFFAIAASVQPLLALNRGSRISQYGHTVWRFLLSLVRNGVALRH